jgi:hypothetical protein
MPLMMYVKSQLVLSLLSRSTLGVNHADINATHMGVSMTYNLGHGIVLGLLNFQILRPVPRPVHQWILPRTPKGDTRVLGVEKS